MTIALGAAVIIWFVSRRERTFDDYLLAYAGVVLLLFGLLEVPGIANTDITEQSLRAPTYTVD